MNQFSEQIMTQFNTAMSNPIFSSVLTLFVILYGTMARPNLPDYIMNLFENPFFRLLVLFLIAFTASKDTKAALLVSLVFLISMNLVSEKKMAEGFMSIQQ